MATVGDPAIGEPDAALRARLGPEACVRAHARRWTLESRGRASWDARAAEPSALDQLLAAIATDVLAGLAHESRRGGPEVRDAELRLQAWLENPLVVAGVVGEAGSARVHAIRGRLFVSTAAPADDVADLWRRVRERAPVLASLDPALSFELELEVFPT